MEHGRVNGAGAQKQACVPNVEHAGDAEITAPLGLLEAIAQDFRVVFPKRFVRRHRASGDGSRVLQ